MNGPVEIGDLTPWKYFTVIAVVIGLLIGLSAPETSELPGWLVTLLWVIQSLLTVALLLSMQQMVQKAGFPGREHLIRQLLLSGFLSVLILSAPLLWLDILTGNNQQPQSLHDWLWSLLDEILGMGPPVILAWLAMNGPFLLGYRLVNVDETEPESGEVNNTEPAFMRLVEPGKRGRVLSLHAELHYLRINTERGSSLVLYNLKDAIDELPSGTGLQCHRSHWVSTDAIKDFRRSGRQGILILCDDSEVPVSRSCVSQVETALNARPDHTVC